MIESPASRYAPGYWMNETSGVLGAVVEKYLEGEALDETEVATMRAYIRQWIAGDAFVGGEIATLRARVDGVVDMKSLNAWLEAALEAGIDPL